MVRTFVLGVHGVVVQMDEDGKYEAFFGTRMRDLTFE